MVGVFLNGAEIVERGPRGEDIQDDSFLLIFNASGEDRAFLLPARRFGAAWDLELNTAEPDHQPGSARFAARSEVRLVAHSALVLKRAT